MKRRPLGHTGLHVSELCLGTMSFGWRIRNSTAMALLDAFVEAGGTFLEATQICPDGLTPPDWAGSPERCIGDWLESRSYPRERLTLATRMVWNPRLHRPGDSLASCCDASLRRLKTDYLDLLIGDWTATTPGLDDLLHALTRLVEQGKVRHLAVTGFPAWEQSERVRRSSIRGLAALATVQSDYSLLDRRCEADLLGRPDGRLGFLARSPLAGGFLAMPAAAGGSIHNHRRHRYLHQRYGHSNGRAVQSAVAAIAQELGATMAQVAFSWVLSNPAVSAALIAPLSLNQLHDAVQAGELALSWPQLRRLDLLSSSGVWADEAAPRMFWPEGPQPAPALALD